VSPGQLTGAHGAVTVGVELLSQYALDYYYHLKSRPGQVGAEVMYRGHKDDVIAAGCISPDVFASIPYFRFFDVGRALVWISSKAGPGKRGWIQLNYYTVDRAFAESLPGVLDFFPGGLPRTGPPDRAGLSRRPWLRLVVDNTRP